MYRLCFRYDKSRFDPGYNGKIYSMAEIFATKEHTVSSLFVSMVMVHCCKCGTPFMMTTALNDACRKEGESKMFYCPNGHPQVYRKSAADRVREEMEAKLKFQEEEARVWMEDADKRALALEDQKRRVKKELRDMKKRIANGVCPCCNRTFDDLAAHMSDKHPGVVAVANGAPVIKKKYTKKTKQ